MTTTVWQSFSIGPYGGKTQILFSLKIYYFIERKLYIYVVFQFFFYIGYSRYKYILENTEGVGHNCTQTNTHKVYKTCTLLQTTGGKDEPNGLCGNHNGHHQCKRSHCKIPPPFQLHPYTVRKNKINNQTGNKTLTVVSCCIPILVILIMWIVAICTDHCLFLYISLIILSVYRLSMEIYNKINDCWLLTIPDK